MHVDVKVQRANVDENTELETEDPYVSTVEVPGKCAAARFDIASLVDESFSDHFSINFLIDSGA